MFLTEAIQSTERCLFHYGYETEEIICETTCYYKDPSKLRYFTIKFIKQHTAFRSRIGSLTSMINDTVKLRKSSLKGPLAYMNQQKLNAFFSN